MAYFYDPNSYTNTLYGRPPPFVCRRPSPPPATYYPREAYDPYVRALAEEQAAIKREREARQRRAEEEARAQMRERQRARQRPQTMYGGYAPGYEYPEYGVSYGYPEYTPARGYSNYGGGYGDMDVDYEDECPQYASYYSAAPLPTREPMRRQPTAPQIRSARFQSRAPMYKNQPTSPKPPSPDTENAPKIHIPISSPTPKPTKHEPSTEEKNTAASKIQSAYRVHHALNAINRAREQFTQLMSSFTFPETLDFDLASPLVGDERPKLTYSKSNAPVHAHEDALVRLLQTLDAVESHGDKDVRERRRGLVREVEKELERIDEEVRRMHEEMRVKQAEVQKKKDEAMEIEQSTAPVAEEAKIDEDTEAPFAPIARPSYEADAIAAHPQTSDLEPQKMEVEPSTAPKQEASVTVSEPIVEEDSPVGATNDSPAESEVETPPQPSVDFPELTIQAEDVLTRHLSSPQPGYDEQNGSGRGESEDVEMQKEAGAPAENVSVRAPEETAAHVYPPTATPVHKAHRVTVEDTDVRDDADEVVIVEEAPAESSPVLTEKEFVVV